MFFKILIPFLLLNLSAAQRFFLPKCTSEYREFSGFCTNTGPRLHRFWGSADRIYFTYFLDRDARKPVGTSRPSARLISNKLFKQIRPKLDRRGLNEMAAYFGQFILHDVSLTPTNMDERWDILLPAGDKVGMFNHSIPFCRSLRGRSSRHDPQEFPINMQTSAIDLSTIYGTSKLRNNALRTGRNGMLHVSDRDLLCISTNTRMKNLPESSEDYFLSGDPRVNENPVLTSLHTLFVREHNRIAKELAEYMPGLSDQMLFMKARLINSAQFQKIVFEEWFPAVTNQELPAYTGFDRNVDPTVSVAFSTAAFQAHHAMFRRYIKSRGPHGVSTTLMKEGQFFKMVSTLQEVGVGPFLRAAFHFKAQAITAKISESRRNTLYSNIPGLENMVDIASEIIQRGRDHGLPSYNKLREKCGMAKAETFEEITSDRDTLRALKKLYDSPDSIDAYPGMLAEEHVEGSSMGPTMLELWKNEFIRLRNGDRFYFRSKKAFPKDLMHTPTVKKLLSDEDTFRRIVLQCTTIKEMDLKMKIFFTN